jgi:hypothetical protein
MLTLVRLIVAAAKVHLKQLFVELEQETQEGFVAAGVSVWGIRRIEAPLGAKLLQSVEQPVTPTSSNCRPPSL